MRFIDVMVGSTVFRAQLLEDRSPHTTAALWDALPFEGRAAHGQWSGAIFRMLEHAPFELKQRDPGSGFQHPGLVVVEPNSGEIAICYGQGRLVSPTGIQAPIPVAQIGGDLGVLAKLGVDLQFTGAQTFSFRRSADQDSPLEKPPAIAGRQIEVVLGQSVSVATMMEDTSAAARAIAGMLPLKGRATNTYSGGPLTRFWNDAGGAEGETPIESDDLGSGQQILYPGYLYYLPLRPWRGIRIPREATAMGGASNNPSPRLIPFARFDDDWSGFRDEASRILVEGAKPMEFRFK